MWKPVPSLPDRKSRGGGSHRTLLLPALSGEAWPSCRCPFHPACPHRRPLPENTAPSRGSGHSAWVVRVEFLQSLLCAVSRRFPVFMKEDTGSFASLDLPLRKPSRISTGTPGEARPTDVYSTKQRLPLKFLPSRRGICSHCGSGVGWGASATGQGGPQGQGSCVQEPSGSPLRIPWAALPGSGLGLRPPCQPHPDPTVAVDSAPWTPSRLLCSLWLF